MKTITVHDKQFVRFISKKSIKEKVKAIAKQINTKYKEKNPIFIIVLRGAFPFGADLVKQFTFSCQVEFVQLTSYQGMQSTQNIQMQQSYDDAILKDRTIIIIEDIVDTGFTMNHFMNHLKNKQAKTIQLAALLLKPECLQFDIEIDYLGFSIPNKFVVGYGLDYNEQARNLTHIYQLAE